MKKYLSTALSAFLSVALLSGCSNDAISEPEIVEVNNPLSKVYLSEINDNPSVTLQSINNIVSRFNPANNSRALDTRIIQDITPVKNELGDTLMYVVNYAGNAGFIIISASKDYDPVLAYSDEGNFDLSKANDSGLGMWLDNEKFNLSNVSKIDPTTREKFNAMWRNLDVSRRQIDLTSDSRSVDIGSMINAQIRQWEQEGCEVYRLEDFRSTSQFQSFPYDVQQNFLELPRGYAYAYFGGVYNTSFVVKRSSGNNTRVEPLCKTQWGQTYGFNKYVSGYDSEHPEFWPLGCVAVALGQILKVHQYPTTISWGDMNNYFPTDVTSRFLKQVAVSADVEFGKEESGSNIDKAKKALNDTYHYNARKIDHFINGITNSDVSRNLDNGYPVYMRGEDTSTGKRHAWVCDGYDSYYSRWSWELWCLEATPEGYDPSAFYNIDTYNDPTEYASISFHMNWGYFGNSNGFFNDHYISFSLSNTIYNFAKNRQDLVDIYPIR